MGCGVYTPRLKKSISFEKSKSVHEKFQFQMYGFRNPGEKFFARGVGCTPDASTSIYEEPCEIAVKSLALLDRVHWLSFSTMEGDIVFYRGGGGATFVFMGCGPLSHQTGTDLSGRAKA